MDIASISQLNKLNKIVDKMGSNIRPKILDGVRDGAKRIIKDYKKKNVVPTKEQIMTDLTSDKRWLGIIEKAGVYQSDIEHEVETILQHPETETFRNELLKTKIGRNMPCPCGSGKKYKKCCGNV